MITITPAGCCVELLRLLKKPVPALLPTNWCGSWLPCPCPACGVVAVDIQSSMSAGSHMKSVMRSSALRVPLIEMTALTHHRLRQLRGNVQAVLVSTPFSIHAQSWR